MSYEVLARKWRPQLFQDVIGQEHITRTLINAVKADRLAHAYLFAGARGVGKTSLARILAKAMNCEQGDAGTPCNRCSSCTEITDGSSMDVQEIDGASNRGIDEIRELRDSSKYMPASSKHRIYIIDEVHMLTIQAFNALLKTLEEPPAHVKFIFATTESHKVPVTIVSRCQKFDFKRIPLAQIVGHLENIAEKENIKISKFALAMIGREAQGSMRDAQSLLDQVSSFSGPEVEDKDIIEILGIIDRDTLFEASRAIIEGSPSRCLEIVDQVFNFGYDIKEFYRALMHQCRNLLVSLTATRDLMLDSTEDEKEEIRCQAEMAGTRKLQILLNSMINREQDLRSSSHPRLILETIMIKLCHLEDFISFEELLGKIESLEKRLVAAIPTGQQPSSGYLSEPGPTWISKDRKQAKGEEKKASQEGEGRTWDEFLAFLPSKSPPMFNVIKDWRFIKLEEDTLEIARSDQSFSSTYFDTSERHDELSGYCRDFFGRDIRVKIVDNDRSKPKKRLPPEKGRDLSSTYADLSPPVQDILQMFQGEIREGYPTGDNANYNSKRNESNEEMKK